MDTEEPTLILNENDLAGVLEPFIYSPGYGLLNLDTFGSIIGYTHQFFVTP